jgi:hypothetical protein
MSFMEVSHGWDKDNCFALATQVATSFLGLFGGCYDFDDVNLRKLGKLGKLEHQNPNVNLF